MKSKKAKIVGYLLLIVFLVAVTIFSQNNVYEIADVFIKLEKSDTQYFSELIKDNWQGITTIPEEKKKILLENLDPRYAAVGIETMRTICIILLYVICSIGVVQCLLGLYKLRQKKRSNQ